MSSDPLTALDRVTAATERLVDACDRVLDLLDRFEGTPSTSVEEDA